MASSSSSSVPTLKTIDDIFQHTVARSDPLPGSKVTNGYAVTTLLPALQKLEKQGTPEGVNALQVCSSATLQNGSDPLDLLLPDVPSESTPRPGIGAAFILSYRLQDSTGDIAKVWKKACSFAATFDPHELISYPALFQSLAESIHQKAFSSGAEIQSVPLLRQLLTGYVIALDSPTTITSVHPVLARAALSTRDYSSVLPFLQTPIDDVDMQYAPITIRHHLLYHYYSGCVLAAVQDFKLACGFFETTVTAPSAVASAISIDAYKKLMLCSIIQRGLPPVLPKYISTPLLNATKSLCQPYADLVSAFASFKRSRVQELSIKHRDVFIRDGNWGLVLQCLERVKAQAVLKLQSSYVTVSMKEIAGASLDNSEEVNAEALQAAEQLLHRLIQSGELRASIDKSSGDGGAVTFLPSPEKYISRETIDMLQQRVALSERLGKANESMGNEVTTSKEFLKKALSSYNSGGSASLGPMGPEEDLLDEED